MKIKLKNYEIESMVSVLNDKNNFFKNTSIKLPFQFRHAMRINAKVLTSRLDIYNDERTEVIKNHKEQNHLYISENGEVICETDYKNEVMKDLNELAAVDNELDFECIEKEVADQVLATNMSIAEEELIETFISKK